MMQTFERNDVMLRRAIVLLLAGSGMGLTYNALSTSGIPLRTPVQPSYDEKARWSLYVEGRHATLAEAKRAFDRRQAIFIDSRSPQAYAAGHIPGALNLPTSEFEARSREVMKDLPKDARIIIYCSGRSCQSSIQLAGRLIERLGYTRAQVFYDGWEAWSTMGYPFVIGELP